MSDRIIQERLESYNCQSVQEEDQAIREITQEIALMALSRADFFKKAAWRVTPLQAGLHPSDNPERTLNNTCIETACDLFCGSGFQPRTS